MYLPQELFDECGRRIPEQSIPGLYWDAENDCFTARTDGQNRPEIYRNGDNRTFALVQFYSITDRLERIKKLAPSDWIFPETARAECRLADMLEKIRRHPLLKNALNGTVLPIVLPAIGESDYGGLVEEQLLPFAIHTSYQMFESAHLLPLLAQGTLRNNTAPAPRGEYDELLYKLQTVPVMGLYLPMALAGFNYSACIRQSFNLPPGFLLAGALEWITAMAWYPEVLLAGGSHLPKLQAANVSILDDDVCWHLAMFPSGTGKTGGIVVKVNNTYSDPSTTAGLFVWDTV